MIQEAKLSFKYRHFKQDIIMIALRWYLSYPLSYRHVEELMQERGVLVDHSTVQRWVERYSREIESLFSKHYRKNKVYTSWHMDETYIQVKGKWAYLYRAIDKEGDTLDFMLSEHRDQQSAFEFFKKTIGNYGLPTKVTMDKSGANEVALIYLNYLLLLVGLWHLSIEIRQIKFLNNRIEQDHRNIKRLTRPMLGFKSLNSAESTLAGYELVNMLRKGQHIFADSMTVYEQFYALAA